MWSVAFSLALMPTLIPNIRSDAGNRMKTRQQTRLWQRESRSIFPAWTHGKISWRKLRRLPRSSVGRRSVGRNFAAIQGSAAIRYTSTSMAGENFASKQVWSHMNRMSGSKKTRFFLQCETRLSSLVESSRARNSISTSATASIYSKSAVLIGPSRLQPSVNGSNKMTRSSPILTNFLRAKFSPAPLKPQTSKSSKLAHTISKLGTLAEGVCLGILSTSEAYSMHRSMSKA